MIENDDSNIKDKLIELYIQWTGKAPTTIKILPESGSHREYYRISNKSSSVIGAFNKDYKENKAFIEYSRFFIEQGLKVPEIYMVDYESGCYLQEDFGDIRLFDLLEKERINDELPTKIVDFYKAVLERLIDFQLKGRELNFKLAYPRAHFDKQSMMWDLSYFKYYFLKLAYILFDEQLLEDDFNRFVDFLLEADSGYFLYRDFQSRNIMVLEDFTPGFIDYQGGRQGALQYDPASLLFDAKANLPFDLREELLNYYLKHLSKYIKIDAILFKKHFYGFVLIRIMQAMGAYGYRGFYEKKQVFLDSIPYALNNLKWLLDNALIPEGYSTLTDVLKQIVNSEFLKRFPKQKELTVTINSFSYKRGVPVDSTGHGGGFVFDCRAIHNPGRYEEYKTKTGKDPEVIAFFEKENEMETFLKDVYSLIDKSVKKYTERGFSNLMVNFGCTGGRHRSVYCAEQLSNYLKDNYPVNVKLKHLEQSF